MSAVFLDKSSVGGAELDWSELQSSYPQWRFYEHSTAAQALQRVADARVLVLNKVMVTDVLLDAAPALELICVTATGLNNVDLAACEQRGIPVRNLAGYCTDSVANYVFAGILQLQRATPIYQQRVQTGEWQQSPHFCLLAEPLAELAGQHMVLLGSGAIGQRVAALATAFGMRVSFAARAGSANDSRPALRALLAQADVLSLHCPLTPATAGLIDERALEQMPTHGVLVNTARGGIVDSVALAAALQARAIAGAVIDVLEQEPPPADHPLLALNQRNLILTPHIAWASQAARERVLSMTAAHIRQHFSRTNV